MQMAIKAAGYQMEVPFTGGRGDAIEAQTDVESFAVLVTQSNLVRNYLPKKLRVKTEELMLACAALLGLSAPEMTVFVGGRRVLGAIHGPRGHGSYTKRAGQLTTGFFVNLLDITNVWKAMEGSDEEFFRGFVYAQAKITERRPVRCRKGRPRFSGQF